MIAVRRSLTVAALVASVLGSMCACSGDGDPSAGPSGSAEPSESSEPESAEPSESESSEPESSFDPFDPFDPSDTSDTDEPPVDSGQLPGDLTPNVVEDECLLTAPEFEALTGQTAIRAENTELAGDGRRSCFYAAATSDEPSGRIDVYSSASLPPAELVSRIAANSAGSRTLTGVGSGAVVVTGQDGTTELVLASPTLLAVLTILPGGASTPPPDESWTTAGTAMTSRMPA